MNFLLEHPQLQVLAVYAGLWAILCVGICLPLITLKLYWSSLLKFFPRESAYHEFDRALHARTETKTSPDSRPSGGLSDKA